jgi:hypothetical protein
VRNESKVHVALISHVTSYFPNASPKLTKHAKGPRYRLMHNGSDNEGKVSSIVKCRLEIKFPDKRRQHFEYLHSQSIEMTPYWYSSEYCHHKNDRLGRTRELSFDGDFLVSRGWGGGGAYRNGFTGVRTTPPPSPSQRGCRGMLFFMTKQKILETK